MPVSLDVSWEFPTLEKRLIKPIGKTTVHHVIGIDGKTLIIFHTQAYCWQFRLISAGGAVFGERKIYYSAEAALKAGLEWVSWGS